MKEKILQLVRFAQDNLSIIILIPAVIGGLWQIIELSSISTSYIRFFSISQIVPDGLLILFILSVIVFSIWLGTKIYSLIDIKVLFDVSRRKEEFFWSLFLFAILFLTYLLLIYPYLCDIQKKATIDLSTLTLLIPVSIFYVGGCFLALFRLLISIILFLPPRVLMKFKELDINKEKKNKLIEKAAKVIAYSLLVLLSFLLSKVVPQIFEYRERLILPNDLVNLNNLNQRIKEKYKVSNNINIRYLNNTYIFYDIETDSITKKILILKTDELFNEDTCR